MISWMPRVERSAAPTMRARVNGTRWPAACRLVGCLAIACAIFGQAAVSLAAQQGQDSAPQDSAQHESAPAAAPPETSGSDEATNAPSQDWAAEVLQQDPLAGQEQVSAADLWRAIEQEPQRPWVIERHFQRAILTEPERRQFLEQAFVYPDLRVQQQAAKELQRRGELTEVVRAKLMEWIRSGDSDAASLAIIGMRWLSIPESNVDAALLDVLVDGLASDSPNVSEAASAQLRRLGAMAVPRLIEALQDPDAPREQAAEVLSQILGEWEPEVAEPEVTQLTPQLSIAPPETITVKSAAAPQPPKYLERHVDAAHPETVRVYYGTNRSLTGGDSTKHPWRWGGLAVIAFLASLWLFTHGKPANAPWVGWFVRRTLWTLVVLALLVFSILQVNEALFAVSSDRDGVQFGHRRSEEGVIHYGYCDVSIPPTHSVGEVERPALGPEDEQHHVVLKRVALLEQAAFYEAVRRVLQTGGESAGDCLLFIHGYNVSFDEAARRAAQIHFDLNFDGATMFYSWPSRASFHHYFSDRNEIGYSHRLIKQFLQGILDNLEFKRFHIIAHSMGADALCQAVMELDPEGKVFDQIILAAPDIDAATFKDQILPRLRQCGTRTTLYCSKNDFALYASKHFNDGQRAGDSSQGPLVANGLDTIDATDMDTEMLGHSYYGNCLRLLEDLRQLIEQNRPPEQRQLEPLLDVSQMRYWVFID